MTTAKKVDAAEVIERVEKGEDVSAAEKRAYDKAMEESAIDKGYVPFQYHGVTMYRSIYNHDRTFEDERTAIEWTAQTRVARNLAGY